MATIESVGSSTRIEGIRLANIEVEALLSGLETASFRSRDEQEVAGYAALMETVFGNWEQILLTKNHIKQMHSILLRHSEKDERHRGHYKTLPNHVKAFGPDGASLGIVFQTDSPFETPFAMTSLIALTREALAAGEFHHFGTGSGARPRQKCRGHCRDRAAAHLVQSREKLRTRR